MLTPAQEMLIKDFNKNVHWLKMQSLKSKDKPEWGSYEEAAKILPRSKQWYNKQRAGHSATLVHGLDWRYCGKNVEYRLEAIEFLRDSLIN